MDPAPLNAFSRYLRSEDILLDVEVSGRDQLFDGIGRHMETEYSMPHDEVVAGLSRRERVGSTGLGAGIALPHCRIGNATQIRIAYLRLKTPIPFDAFDGQPVSDILVVLVPKQAVEEHLLVLADIARVFSDRRFMERLHACRSPQEAQSLLSSHA